MVILAKHKPTSDDLMRGTQQLHQVDCLPSALRSHVWRSPGEGQ